LSKTGPIWTLLLVLTLETHAQVKTFSFAFDSLAMEKAIETIEQNSPYSFYYKKQWIDSLYADGNFQNMTITEILDDLLVSNQQQYVIMGNKIILTGNTQVTSSLSYDQDTSGALLKAGYVFAREYAGEEDVVVIGNRSQMASGEMATLSGMVKDEENQPIAGAVVYTEADEYSSVSNARGYFELALPVGEHVLLTQFSGMKVKRQKVVIFSDGQWNVLLEGEPQMLQEVVVLSDENASVNDVKMGTNSLNLESIKNVPKFMGENDVVQAALMLPGVQNVGEGSAGINIRGGKADQNLILLNGATVYNPFHYFGFFSSFNADITGGLELMKGNIPAMYGGRLSSLMNVTMKRASKNKFGAKLSVNLITTSASVEVPIIKDKTAVMAGMRTTYSDWILNNVGNKTVRNSDPSFSDYAINVNHSYGENNSINLSAYYSQDAFKLSTDSLNSYSNRNVTAEWNHMLSEKLIATVMAGWSRYEFDIKYDALPTEAFNYGFSINELFGKAFLSYFPSDRHNITMGMDYKWYNVNPGQIDPLGESDVLPESIEKEQGLENALFVSDEYKLTPKITIYGGLRYSFFSPYGSRNIRQYQEGQPITNTSFVDETNYGPGERIDTYHGPEIRLSGKYAFNDELSLKMGITQMRQYIHSISNTVSVSPTDTWKLSDPNFAPKNSFQYSIGLYKFLWNRKVEASIETYYKNLNNLLDYRVGADLVLNNNLETEVLQGDGKSYGVELLLRKPGGRLNGWLSYAWSRSLQRFDSPFVERQINGGEFFPSNFDKPHAFKLVANYRHTRRLSSSLNVVYTSGRPVTYPTAKYQLDEVEITHFADRNQFRIPDYFRVDVSFNLEGSHKKEKLAHGYWSFTVYNVLSRNNVFSVFFANANGEIQGYELSILADAIPSLTYNVSF